MDANGQKFWSLTEARQWSMNGVRHDAKRCCLHLAQQRENVEFLETDNAIHLDAIPWLMDSFGNTAYWDHESEKILVIHQQNGTTEPYPLQTTLEDTPTDMLVGYDGILYIASAGKILLHDMRHRWKDRLVEHTNVIAWRLAADPRGGVWVLDRVNRQCARLSGEPLPDRPFSPYQPDVFRPCEGENPVPTTITPCHGSAIPNHEIPLAIAANSAGRVVVLSRDVAVGHARVRELNQHGRYIDYWFLSVMNTFSATWVNDDRLAVMVTGEKREPDIGSFPVDEAPAYDLIPHAEDVTDNERHELPVGELYKFKPGHMTAPFVHSLEKIPRYRTERSCEPLYKLSFPFYRTRGEARNNETHAALDSGNSQTVWHRVYLEAVIPKGCGIIVYLSADDNVFAAANFYEHRFGELFKSSGKSDIPLAVWESSASEISHHKGLLPCALVKDQAGLFSVLVQRPGLKTRNLQGRQLKVKLKLIGTGQTSPEIYGFRVYASRFSYINNYLPQLYWENTFAPDADKPGPATGADFMERFVGNFEGILTNIEDRITHSYLLTDPRTTPVDSLGWLANWLGQEFEPAMPETSRRELLQRTNDLYRWHGTVRGLKLALEIATNGGVSSGEIVVLEDYKLRRTFATILGADLDEEDDPLTSEAVISGNSYIGDTLFIGDENNNDKAFLALFSADLHTSAEEQQAIDDLFDKLANRVTVLVHNEVEPQELGLIEQVARKEVPAHVELQVITASYPFIVGMASLVGVDSYLLPEKQIGPVNIGSTRLGRENTLQGRGAFNSLFAERSFPGIPGIALDPPIARLTAAADMGYGEHIVLDGSASEASVPLRINNYQWSFLE